MAAASREAVYAALFAMFAPLDVANGGQFQTLTRRLLFAEDMAGLMLPALFQLQVTEAADTQVMNGVIMWKASVDIYVYCEQPDTLSASTPILNPLVDQVMAVLPSGSLVQPMQFIVNGVACGLMVRQIEYFEGLLGTRAVARLSANIWAPL